MIGVRVDPLHESDFDTDCTLDTFGFADVEASIPAIRDWIKSVAWDGPSVDTSSWLISGHSNGGK